MNKKKNTTKGFTLVEIIVSVAIFAIIITSGIGALVTILDSYQKTQQQKNLNQALNYALDTMVREIRLGKNYGYDGIGSGDGTNNEITFDATDNRGEVRYSLSGGAVVLDRSGASIPRLNGTFSLTDSTSVQIDELSFTISGNSQTPSGNNRQPRVWITLAGHDVRDTDQVSTVVQTLVSQRTLNI
ncbi:hypothetical protein CL684_01030 [Candidatus Campbellbacteria bacterium]|nr:hypothetical protein [Candidatus Campbellbacteria bacterium]|tara:strand:- start:422 stop:979 length:558 start_codon:yes stop_codon:yes gene_type:complete